MLAEGAFLQLHLEIDRWILKGKKKKRKSERIDTGRENCQVFSSSKLVSYLMEEQRLVNLSLKKQTKPSHRNTPAVF